MALRCSLLGHDFGETEVDREREERGSEVVVTVTEYQRCQRCGEKNVISENTEVTALGPDTAARSPDESASDQPPSPGIDDPASGGLQDGESTEEAATSAGDPSDAAEVDVEAEAEAVAGDADETAEEDEDGDDDLEIPTDENGDPITDDAEILTEPDPDDGDREHGEWPESDDVGPPVGSAAEPTAWPEEEGADGDGNGDDSSVESDDLETTFVEEDVGAGANTNVNTGENETVTENEATRDEPVTDDAVFVDAEPEPSPQQSDSYTGIASAQAAPDPSKATTQGGANTEFFCPQCSFVAPGDRGSLRAGDICPECRKGYLGERER
ncbi:DUF7093 family protein [Natronosalvus halobius]|uniref:DUF7093 family protein n=1 Tax=Natronosalvus halobius TaxID=2953746 RepID=UPI00209FADED|nr:hypothetical protein [Natronosalvus halobius]USZ70546.1 hypothetical protein NGM15_10540 [Natronosalvus halobius]